MRVGGFINQLVLSSDGRQLASTDPTQAYVTATRVGSGPTPPRAPIVPQRPSQPPSNPEQPANGPRPLRYLVATISGNYRDSKYLGDLLGVYIALGRSVALEPGSKLAFTYVQCDNRSVNAPSFASLASACDRKLGGMEWVRKTLRMDIDRSNNPSVEVVQASRDPDARYGLQLRTNKGNSSWTNIVGCGNQTNCATLAADLRELFARVGNEATVTAPAEASPREVERLVSSLGESFGAGVWNEVGHAYSNEFFGWNVRKVRAARLLDDFTLALDSVQCTPPDWFSTAPNRARNQHEFVSLCDRGAAGLGWKPDTWSFRLKEIDPTSIRTTAGRDGFDLLFQNIGDPAGARNVGCPDRAVCEQTAETLRNLVELVHSLRQVR